MRFNSSPRPAAKNKNQLRNTQLCNGCHIKPLLISELIFS